MSRARSSIYLKASKNGKTVNKKRQVRTRKLALCVDLVGRTPRLVGQGESLERWTPLLESLSMLHLRSAFNAYDLARRVFRDAMHI
ncbi:hypothetical protein K438DRAFT_1972338 [Mycena galopus ATCC 62051]|nr:hypothetical protein K438DRAFT_1972338 [Mycena galopus ATCC 62051]